MKIINSIIYEGKNIYSHKKCIRLDLDLEGYCETPSNKIKGFNDSIIRMIPEFEIHRCGIDEDRGFIKRLEEGTYLAHICEHAIIALQNRVGIDVAYGKAREIKDDIYYIIFQYEYKRAAIECAKLAIDIINSLLKQKEIDIDERVLIIQKILNEETMGPTTKAICDSGKKYNMPVMKVGDSGLYQIGYGKQGRLVEAAISYKTSCIAADISCDKLLTKEILSLQSIPVSKAAKVTNIISLLKDIEVMNYPLVLKPQYGNKGNGVILNIKDEKELLRAYKELSKTCKDIIVEEYCIGNDYRVCVINNEVVAVALRVPPSIIGDGISTIDKLIDLLNNDNLRGDGHEKPLTKINKDTQLINCIKEEGYSLDSVLEEGVKLKLRNNANLSTGGYAIDCTDEISEENKEICIRAAKAIGLDICGIDICSEDISKSLIESGSIIEINTAPGLRMHTHPTEGKSRDVGEAIINMMYDNDIKNIPIVSITGTNGKTTTTRLINSVFSKIGYTTGMTSTEGVYVGNKCIHKGDDTGASSAKSILTNRDVDIAILETARGGIIKKGLAYNTADIAIITNVREDHLGCDGVNTIEDLFKVKSLVAEAVNDNGYVILNADDKWCVKMADRATANIVYFSKEKENKYVLKNISENKMVVYLENEFIYIHNCGIEYKLCRVNDIPIILNGALEFNIENVMAAIAGLVALKVDYKIIEDGIKSFELNSEENSGRFNIYEYGGVKIILDYGHNLDGYSRVLESARKITEGNIIGVIGIPGDRQDSTAINIGKLSSKLIDKIIIKEDLDSRGRDKGEIAELIKKGIVDNKKKQDVKIVLNEVEAFKTALSESKSGDCIIVFYEKREPLVNFIDTLHESNIITDIAKTI